MHPQVHNLDVPSRALPQVEGELEHGEEDDEDGHAAREHPRVDDAESEASDEEGERSAYGEEQGEVAGAEDRGQQRGRRRLRARASGYGGVRVGCGHRGDLRLALRRPREDERRNDGDDEEADGEGPEEDAGERAPRDGVDDAQGRQEVLLDDGAQDDAEEERRARPLEELHDEADAGEHEDDGQREPARHRDHAAEDDDGYDDARNDGIGDAGQLHELAGGGDAEHRDDEVADGEREHEEDDDVGLVAEQAGAGGEVHRDHRDEHEGPGESSGDAEGEGGDGLSGLLRVLGGLCEEHAVEGSLAELALVLRPEDAERVGEPVDHGGADAGDGAEDHAEDGLADHNRPAPQAVAGAAHHLAGADHGVGGSDGAPRDGEVDELGEREESEGYRDDGESSPELRLLEDEPDVAGDGVDADGAEHHAERSGDESLHHRARAERRDHRDAEERHRGDLGEAELEDDGLDDGHERGEHDGADESSECGDGVDGAERVGGLALAGELVAFEEGHLGGASGESEQHGGDGVECVVDSGHRGERDEADGALLAAEDVDDEGYGERHDDDAPDSGDDAGDRRDEHGHEHGDPVEGVSQIRDALPYLVEEIAFQGTLLALRRPAEPACERRLRPADCT